MTQRKNRSSFVFNLLAVRVFPFRISGATVLNCNGRLSGKVKMTVSAKPWITSYSNLTFFFPFFSFIAFLFNVFVLGVGKKEEFAAFSMFFESVLLETSK